MVPGLEDLSYPERLRKLDLPTLVYRRLRGDMIECYKITNDIYDIRSSNFLIFHRFVSGGLERRGHNKKLYVDMAKKVVRRSSFAYRVNDIWNNLPEKLVNASSINEFKNNLDKHWKNEEIMYNFEKAYNKFKIQERDIDFS